MTSPGNGGIRCRTGPDRGAVPPSAVATRASEGQTPPAGGDHSAVWQNASIYDAPIANANAVHTLEHGGFWITYQPGLPADHIAAIKAAVAGQAYALVSPYPGQPSPVETTAWGVQLRLGSATDPRLAVFIAAYADASKAPEPHGEVTGGTGTRTR